VGEKGKKWKKQKMERKRGSMQRGCRSLVESAGVPIVVSSVE
jgi:hypothetical protein